MFKFFNVTKDNNFREIKEEHFIEKEVEIEKEVWQVALDIIETRHEIIILAPVAWVDLSDIDISVNENVLTISWYRERPEIYLKEIILKNSECFWWEFSRNIILPENLDFDSIKANLDNNLLVVTIPKIRFTNHSVRVEKV